MWKAIRNCMPCKETTQPIYTRDIKLLANKFNEFFTTEGARTAENVKSLANENGISQMTFTSFDSFTGDEFVLRAVSTAEVRKIAFLFGSNKAPGPVKLPMKLIKGAVYFTNFNRNYQQLSTYISFSVRLEGSRSDCVAER